MTSCQGGVLQPSPDVEDKTQLLLYELTIPVQSARPDFILHAVPSVLVKTLLNALSRVWHHPVEGKPTLCYKADSALHRGICRLCWMDHQV